MAAETLPGSLTFVAQSYAPLANFETPTTAVAETTGGMYITPRIAGYVRPEQVL